MCVDMSNPPDARDKDLFSSPALSLSLAGIFRRAGSPVAAPGDSTDDNVEISSENSGPARSRSEYELIAADDDDGGDGDRGKKRKKYHRHTAEQIREMEALFKESPHPDEKQRQELSKQLGLSSRQVKFWFQNRRTQIKAIQERHENSLLKGEIEKLREENRAIREALQTGSCPNCGFSSSGRDVPQEKNLLIENSRLRAEVEKLRSVIGNHPSLGSSPSSSFSTENLKENKISTEYYTGVFGLQKSRILEIVEQATDELKKIATAGEPLWMRSVETGREILNYDEYMKEFSGISYQIDAKTHIEASKGSATVFVDLPRLVQSFVDVNKWKELFPSLVSRAATIDVICRGEGGNNNGNVQLIFAELQVLSPMVPTREVYFVRHSKQLNDDLWAIVDVSIDNLEENIDSSLIKCRKRPSGCIIEDKSNGHCQVTWIEHSECKRSSIHSLYRAIVNSGQAFGAKRWLATLRSQCEQIVFSMATNVPTKDSSGVNTLAGRKSILNLAQRMTSSFCRAIGGSSRHSWTKITTKAGDDLRFSSRKNLNDPGESPGLILCAVSSIWLPVPPDLLFEFLSHRIELWYFSFASEFRQASPQTIASLAKGQHRGNSVTIRKLHVNESTIWILQDSSTNAYESTVVYAPVDIPELQSVMAGCNSNNVAILSSGFSILADGMETRPLVITSKQEKSTEGSLLTIAFQVQANPSPSAKLTTESVESVSTLISTTLRNIRARLQCDDA